MKDFGNSIEDLVYPSSLGFSLPEELWVEELNTMFILAFGDDDDRYIEYALSRD